MADSGKRSAEGGGDIRGGRKEYLCGGLKSGTGAADMSFSQIGVPGMRIYDTNLNGASAAETGRAQELQKVEQNSTARSSSRNSAGAGDRVEFSGGLGRLSQTLSSFRQDRAARVQALEAQYQGGKYRADASATSRGMVAEALGASLK